MKKTVLLFGFDEEEQKRAKMALMPLRLSVRAIGEEEKTGTFAELLGIEDVEAAADAARPEAGEGMGKMMYMAGLEEADLNRLLAAMRKAGFPRSVLKAMATPTNIGWTPEALWAEIHREHNVMNG